MVESLLTVIATYYIWHGRRFLCLSRLGEPVFIVNAIYILNFPVRAACFMLIPDSLESAPTLVLDETTLAKTLLYSFTCVVIFNVSYQWFMTHVRWQTGDIHRVTLPGCEPVPKVIYWVYLLMALVYLYFAMTTTANKTLLHSEGVTNVPPIIRAIPFTADFIIVASLLMFVVTKQPLYAIVGAAVFTPLMYNAFLQTAKGLLIGYLLISSLILVRLGYQIKLRHILVSLGVVVPYVIYSYLARTYAVGIASTDMPILERFALLGSALDDFTIYQLFEQLFLLKITDRQAYLDTLMIYMQAGSYDVSIDVYDRLGSLPVVLSALLNVLHITDTSTEDFLLWFGNKYWYGLAWPTMEVFIPFGRITESYMILSQFGFVMFIGYAYVFVFLYRRFYCSGSGLAIIYYVLMYYYFIYADVYLAFNLTTIVYWSLFYFATVWIYFRVAGRNHREACLAAGGEDRRTRQTAPDGLARKSRVHPAAP